MNTLFRFGSLAILAIALPACGVGGGNGTLSPTTAPGIPAGVTVLTGNRSLTVSWTKSPAATFYDVLRSPQPGGPYLPVTGPGGCTETTFTDNSLTNGKTYYYVVTATNSFGSSPDSSQVQGTPRVDAVKVATGGGLTLAILADGSVWGWGSNSYGLLGEPDTFPQSDQGVQIDLRGVIDIAVAGDVGLALLGDGTVWGWGKNAAGTIGNGTTTPSLLPVQSQTPPGVTKLFGRSSTAMAITGSGELWGWGSNYKGVLGLPTTTANVPVPQKISGFSNVIAAAGSPAGDSTLVVTSDGTVWSCGNNATGQLGDGTTNSRTTFQPVVNLTDVVAVSCGMDYSVALDSNGIVWTWGSPANNGNAGLGHAPGPLPTPIPSLTAIQSIAAGYDFTVALRVDGTVWTTGNNNEGALGNPAVVDGTTTPVQVQISNIRSISAGIEHVAAIDTNGLLWGWGYNQRGELGIGESVQLAPGRADSLTQVTDAIMTSAGGMALRSDHSLWSWGDGTFGTLGDGSTTRQTGLRVHVVQTSMTTPVSLGGMGSVRYAIDTGAVWGWGYGGQMMGTGTLLGPHQLVPLKIIGSPSFVQVSAGASDIYAVTTTGLVYGWGNNASGFAGIGGGIYPFAPTQLPTLSGVKSVAAGSQWAMAVTGTGDVWGWGYVPYSTGLPSPLTSAVKNTTLSNIASLAAGQSFGLAVDKNGGVWGFGSSPLGELGALNVNRSTPVQLTGFSSIVGIAAGQNHCLALKTDGTVLAWGSNFFGELGNGTTSTSGTATPAVVPLPGPAVKVSAGGRCSLALLADGSVWTWGDNSDGQLGNGATGFTWSPVLISQ